ncbi:MAG: TonB family protein [Bacteroidetes bacterium]|nr:TonB family protein [Bacteroidota bacterium]
MKIVFIITVVLCNFSAFGNSGDTTFFDKNWNRTKPKNAAYFRPPLQKVEEMYKVTDYYMSGIKQMESFSLSQDSIILTGYTVRYDSIGNKEAEGQCLNNVESGEWKYYYPGTNILYFIENYFNGQRLGKFTSYYKSGKIKTEENYFGSQVTGKRYNEAGEEFEFYPMLQQPVYSQDTRTFLSENIRYPFKCQNKKIEGTVIISLYIDETGKLCDTKIIQNADPLMDKEALRVINLMKKWIPGKFDDKPVKMWVSQRVSFQLTD